MELPEPDKEQIKTLFDHIYQIDEQAWASTVQIIEFQSLQKNQLLAQAGKNFVYEVLIVEGVIRSFITDEKGADYTLEFYRTGDFLAPHFSRTHEARSFVSLEALGPTRIILLEATQFTQLRRRHDSLMNFGAKISEAELFRKTNKEIRMATRTAKERYFDFQKRYSKLENLIPQTVIASYLGISPVSLSRLRAEKQ
ncbi:MAG: Crp/Fnr family transcriptional regulator [Roseivirga sp.]|nr:Crp/Fnr family transcriptional regulator [Roseivirga sp.]